MNVQNIIAALIVVAALAYVANVLRHKIKAFQPKNGSCGADCGCESKKSEKL